MAKKKAAKPILLPETLKSTASVWTIRRDIPLAILGWIAVVVVIFLGLGYISHALILVLIAALLAYALAPIVRFCERFIPRFLALILVYIIFFLGLGVLLYVVFTTAVEQFQTLSHNISFFLTPKGSGNPPFVVALEKFGIAEPQIAQAREQVIVQAEKLSSSILPFLSSIVTFIIDLFLIAILSIYLLIDGKRIMDTLKRNTPIAYQSRVIFFMTTLERIVGGYIRGQIALAASVGLLIGVGMAILHVPYAILLGVLAFILEFIPILGTFISGAICVLVAIPLGLLTVILVLGYFIIMHVIEGDILGPRIVGKALGLHPLVSIIALVIGSELYGIVGALFAAPIAGLTQAILVTLWSEWKLIHPEAFLKEEVTETKNITKPKKLHLLR